MYTTEEFKDLSDYVYALDKKDDGYDPNLKAGKTKKINDINYKILAVEDNTTNGMQAMAVAPVINGEADTSQVVIAYAGTNSGDTLDLITDAQTVVGRNKKMGFYNPAIETFNPKNIENRIIDGQVITAEKFAAELKEDYPDAVITTTGHSLGEYLALYIAAENQWKNVGFNGQDPYSILSKDAKKWVKENPGMLINYRNERDLIGNFNFNGTGAEIRVNMDKGGKTPKKEKEDPHALKTWKFDKNGQLLIWDTFANKEALLIRAEKYLHLQLYDLTLLKQKFVIMGGGSLSTSEEIYLENMEALLVVENAAQSMRIGLDYVMKIYQDGILRAKETWAEGFARAQAIGTELSYDEVISALAAGGATKANIVDEPTAYYEEKIAIAKEIGSSFDVLSLDIKNSIGKLAQADQDLGNQIRRGA